MKKLMKEKGHEYRKVENKMKHYTSFFPLFFIFFDHLKKWKAAVNLRLLFFRPLTCSSRSQMTAYLSDASEESEIDLLKDLKLKGFEKSSESAAFCFEFSEGKTFFFFETISCRFSRQKTRKKGWDKQS